MEQQTKMTAEVAAINQDNDSNIEIAVDDSRRQPEPELVLPTAERDPMNGLREREFALCWVLLTLAASRISRIGVILDSCKFSPVIGFECFKGLRWSMRIP